MAIYTKKGFQELLDLKKGYISTYVKRGRLVVNGEGNIDDTHPLNKIFKEKLLAKKINQDRTKNVQIIEEISSTKKESVKSEIPKKSQDSEIASSSAKQLNFYADLEKIKAELDVQKKEEDLKITILKREQLEGKVIPTDLVISLFKRQNINIITSFHQSAKQISSAMNQQLGGKREDLALINQKMIKSINDAIEKTKQITKAELKSIIDEHSIKRNQGEKK